MAPVVHQVQLDYAEQVNFIYLDIDNPATGSLKQALHYIPGREPFYLLLDPQGKILNEWRGFVTGERFRLAIEAALAR